MGLNSRRIILYALSEKIDNIAIFLERLQGSLMLKQPVTYNSINYLHKSTVNKKTYLNGIQVRFPDFFVIKNPLAC